MPDNIHFEVVGTIGADAGQLIIASDTVNYNDLYFSAMGQWAGDEHPVVPTKNVDNVNSLLRVTTGVGDGTFPVCRVVTNEGVLQGYFIHTNNYGDDVYTTPVTDVEVKYEPKRALDALISDLVYINAELAHVGTQLKPDMSEEVINSLRNIIKTINTLQSDVETVTKWCVE